MVRFRGILLSCFHEIYDFGLSASTYNSMYNCTSVNGMVGVMYVSVTDLPIIADAIQVSRTDVNLPECLYLKFCITYV